MVQAGSVTLSSMPCPVIWKKPAVWQISSSSAPTLAGPAEMSTTGTVMSSAGGRAERGVGVTAMAPGMAGAPGQDAAAGQRGQDRAGAAEREHRARAEERAEGQDRTRRADRQNRTRGPEPQN